MSLAGYALFGLGEGFEGDFVAEAFELGDDGSGGAVGVRAAGELVAAEVVVAMTAGAALGGVVHDPFALIIVFTSINLIAAAAAIFSKPSNADL